MEEIKARRWFWVFDDIDIEVKQISGKGSQADFCHESRAIKYLLVIGIDFCSWSLENRPLVVSFV